jgi:hypothetical protein
MVNNSYLIMEIPNINLRDLNEIILKKYMLETKENKQALCWEIIFRTFREMKIKADVDARINAAYKVLNRSIEINEKFEKYELCNLLKDIQIELKNKDLIEKLHQTAKSEIQ